jgi:hypothetical protein
MGFSSNILIPGPQIRKLLQGEIIRLVCKTKRHANPLPAVAAGPITGPEPTKKERKRKTKVSKQQKATSNSSTAIIVDDEEDHLSDVVEMFPVIQRPTAPKAR